MKIAALVVPNLFAVFLGLTFSVMKVAVAELMHHNHSGHHAGMVHEEQMEPPEKQPAAKLSTPHSLHPGISDNVSGRNAYTYADGLDFSGLSKPMMGDGHALASLIVDRLEAVAAHDDMSMTYDWQAWWGGDYDRLVVRAEGEIDSGSFKDARNEALWGHALSAFWDTQIGLRYDSGLGADRVWGALGVQGYAPYWIYVEATAYIGEEGRTAFRLETEYDLLITQRLILQPRVEVNFYSQSDASRFISSGLSSVEAGLRLRYEFKREFAPYIGVEWAGTLGSAADALRAQGKKPESVQFIAGVHFWF